MNVLIVGGRSSVAQVLALAMSEWAHVKTAGRCGCDSELALSWAEERFSLLAGVNVVLHVAAYLGGGRISLLSRRSMCGLF